MTVDKIWIEGEDSGVGGNRAAIFTPDYPYVHVPFDDFDKIYEKMNTKFHGLTETANPCVKEGR